MRSLRGKLLLVLLLLGAHIADVCATDYQTVLGWLSEHADAPSDGLAPGTYGQQQLSELVAYLAPGYAPEFDFPEIDLSRYTNRDVLRRLDGINTYVMERQYLLEAGVFTADRNGRFSNPTMNRSGRSFE